MLTMLHPESHPRHSLMNCFEHSEHHRHRHDQKRANSLIVSQPGRHGAGAGARGIDQHARSRGYSAEFRSA